MNTVKTIHIYLQERYENKLSCSKTQHYQIMGLEFDADQPAHM